MASSCRAVLGSVKVKGFSRQPLIVHFTSMFLHVVKQRNACKCTRAPAGLAMIDFVRVNVFFVHLCTGERDECAADADHEHDRAES